LASLIDLSEAASGEEAEYKANGTQRLLICPAINQCDEIGFQETPWLMRAGSTQEPELATVTNDRPWNVARYQGAMDDLRNRQCSE